MSNECLYSVCCPVWLHLFPGLCDCSQCCGPCFSRDFLLKFKPYNAVPNSRVVELYPRHLSLYNVGKFVCVDLYNSMHLNSHLVKIALQSVGAAKGGGPDLTVQSGKVLPYDFPGSHYDMQVLSPSLGDNPSDDTLTNYDKDEPLLCSDCEDSNTKICLLSV